MTGPSISITVQVQHTTENGRHEVACQHKLADSRLSALAQRTTRDNPEVDITIPRTKYLGEIWKLSAESYRTRSRVAQSWHGLRGLDWRKFRPRETTYPSSSQALG